MSERQHFEVPQEYAELYERAYRQAAAEDLDDSPHPSAGTPAPVRRAGGRRKQDRRRRRRTSAPPPPVVPDLRPSTSTARIEVAPSAGAPPTAGRRARSGRRRRGGWWRGDIALAVALVLLLAALGAAAALLGRLTFGRPADDTAGLLGLVGQLLRPVLT
ncbi:hypothetical protein GCM10027425_03460 [Alteromonas gracilis]